MSALERSTSSTWLLSSACRTSPRRSASFSREPNLQAYARVWEGAKHEDHQKWKIIAEEATLCEGYLSFRLSSLEAILSDETVGLGKSLCLRLQQILQSILLGLVENTRPEKHKGLELNRAPSLKTLNLFFPLSPLLTANADSFRS